MAWMNLKGIMLSRTSKIHKATQYMIPFRLNSTKSKTIGMRTDQQSPGVKGRAGLTYQEVACGSLGAVGGGCKLFPVLMGVVTPALYAFNQISHNCTSKSGFSCM